jgi:PPOX class probable F420-dependent enzyme
MRISADEARQRFGTALVARLATVSEQGRPHVVPCTFAVDGDVVYTAVDHKPKSTTDLKRLRNISARPAAALLVDYYDDDWSALWWARADGQASVIADQAAIAAPVRLLASRYPQYAARPPGGPVISIAVTHWSGWSAS